nr:PREDICTED: uncharacterized protein LOC107398917 [Tribolium castaneum]|eukprot:XP_015839965.1 PREDICTED: uncharacterized protein LOC107398917 [Tribolium castaneum]
MAAFRNLTYDAIFGNKKSLRPGVDDEKLLELLNADCSDIDISDEENELDPEPEEIFNDELQNEQTEEEEANDQREEREDSEEDDDEDDLLPLSVVRDNLLVAQAQNSTSKAKRTSWKRKSTFTPPNFDWTEPENDFERRLAWTAKDYLSMYFTDEDFQKNCDCTNARYVEVKGVSLNLTLLEIKKFLGMITLMSCLKYPRIRMYWAKTTRVEAIARNMTRDRFFSIRSNLKVVVDGDVTAAERNLDKFWKMDW